MTRSRAVTRPKVTVSPGSSPQEASDNESAIAQAVLNSPNGIAIVGATGGDRVGDSSLSGFSNQPGYDHVAVAYKDTETQDILIAELEPSNIITSGNEDGKYFGSSSPDPRSLPDFSGSYDSVTAVSINVTNQQATDFKNSLQQTLEPGSTYSFETNGNTCASGISEAIRNSGLDPTFGSPTLGVNTVTPSDIVNHFQQMNSGDNAGVIGGPDGSFVDPPINHPFYYRFVIPNNNGGSFSLSGKTDDLGNISVALPPNRPVYLMVYEPISRTFGASLVQTGPSGITTSLSMAIGIGDSSLDYDLDQDGLPDNAEIVIGTNPDKYSTTGDGISDGAKIQAGLDPLAGVAFPTGLIASLPLQGEAKAVVVEGSNFDSQGQTAYIAMGSFGLAIVDASRFQKPIIVSQLDLPGDATDVAVDTTLKIAAVATNSGGLQLVDVTDPTAPTLMRTLNLAASQVKVVNGIAYGTVGNALVAVDLFTGDTLQTLGLGGSTITGLAREGSMLYSMDTSFTLRAIDIGGPEMVLRGSLTLTHGGGMLFVGNGIVYVPAADAPRLGGFATVNASNPDSLTLISTGNSTSNVFPGTDFAGNGSGLGILVGQPIGPGGPTNLVDIMDVSDPTNTTSYLTQFNLPARRMR